MVSQPEGSRLRPAGGALPEEPWITGFPASQGELQDRAEEESYGRRFTGEK